MPRRPTTARPRPQAERHAAAPKGRGAGGSSRPPVDFPIDAIVVGPRFRHDLGDVEGLAASIKEHGLLQPISIEPGGALIFGLRRLEAAKRLGHKTVPALVIDPSDPRRVEAIENLAREDFSPSERVAIALTFKDEERRAARQRRGRRGGKFAPGQGGKVRDILASQVGWSGHTLDKAIKVVEAAQADPHHQDLVEDMDRTGKVDGAYQRLQTRLRLEEIDQQERSLPRGKFRTIVADPPWDVSHARAQYPTMSTEAICALGEQVRAATAEDGAHLYLWAINEKLHDAFHVMDAWGFRYITTLTWSKPGRQGQGHYYRSNTEHILFGVHGRAPAASHEYMTLFEAPRRGSHSTKPDYVFFPMVEAVSPAPRLEMFARRRREGWTVWGFDAPKA